MSYLNMQQCSVEGFWDEYKEMKEKQYGKHNLVLQPKIKTWEDYEKVKGKINVWVNVNGYIPEDRVNKKAVATLKIDKLIELGYGGRFIWNDCDMRGVIVPCKGGYQVEQYVNSYNGDKFLSFRNPRLAYEFLEQPSNVELLNQYFMRYE